MIQDHDRAPVLGKGCFITLWTLLQTTIGVGIVTAGMFANQLLGKEPAWELVAVFAASFLVGGVLTGFLVWGKVS